MGEYKNAILHQLGGKWRLDRAENFDAALKEMGLYLI